MSDSEATPSPLLALRPTEPNRVIARGHPVGDQLDAHLWEVIERGRGHLRVRAPLVDRVLNPRGQLFGGFTATYVDFVSLFAFWAGRDDELERSRSWLATLNMRIDYFAPVTGPEFEMDARVVHMRGGTGMIETRFYPASDPKPGDSPRDPLVYAYTTLKATS